MIDVVVIVMSRHGLLVFTLSGVWWNGVLLFLLSGMFDVQTGWRDGWTNG